MKQPELGKKISELRKAKGLTQEELVEKCNLSVRTLIRIENGEVMPRSFTIKTIFSALDYKFYDSQENLSNKFSKHALFISKRFEHLYRYFHELFNLKTNTMRKVSILSVPIFALLSLFLFFCFRSSAQDNIKIQKQIDISNKKFVQWFNSGQIDSLGLLYIDNANLIFDNIFPIFNDNLPAIKGRDGIKSYYTFYNLQKINFIERKSKKMVFDNSTVVDIGIIQLNGDSLKIKGTYFCQWHYKDGKWVIENEMFNFDRN